MSNDNTKNKRAEIVRQLEDEMKTLRRLSALPDAEEFINRMELLRKALGYYLSELRNDE